MALKVLLICFQCILTGPFGATGYVKNDFIATAKDMLNKFSSLPVVPYGKSCANTNSTTLFHKYVIGIEKTLASLNYDNTKSIEALEKGYYLLSMWRVASGWKCDPNKYECKPPKQTPNQTLNQAHVYKCDCVTLRGATQDYKTELDPATASCKYINEKSVCSENRTGILCKESDHVCLIKNIHLRCNPENVKKLMDYLETRFQKRQADDCKCTPKSLEQVNIKVNETFTSKNYVTAGKQERGPGQKCADVELKIKQEIGKHTDAYVLPPEALEAFNKLRDDPDVVECDDTKQLTCVTPPGEVYGICECPLVDYRTGWQNHPEHMTTSNGNCALAENSDCGTIKDFHFFECYKPDECVIMELNVRCTPENWLEALTENKWSLLPSKNPDAYRSNSSEKYIRRCHCLDGRGDQEIYGDFEHLEKQSSAGVGLYCYNWVWVLLPTKLICLVIQLLNPTLAIYNRSN